MSESDYEFVNGYPTAETVRRAYDDADFHRAVQTYKFFYPTVAFTVGFERMLGLGLEPNRHVPMMMGSPKQLVFTPNSDTPYAFAPLDLTAGPVVITLPPGPIMGAVNDLNQQWVMDYGVPGPDAGRGGRHLLLPPGFAGEVPDGYHASRTTTNRVTALLRALPVGGDTQGAERLIKSISFARLGEKPWNVEWVDINDQTADLTPVSIERTLAFWETLHRLIDAEPSNDAYRNYYGDLAALGITKGQPFAPDARIRDILERAAVTANDQMRVQSFADRREDRLPWPDRTWEWASLRPENGTFDTDFYRDLTAREKWFYQAMVESPAMFRRAAGGGSLYWLGARDLSGTYLDGGKRYRLRIPLPVPAQLFWSITLYDNQTRSEIQTDQGYAALRSLFELGDIPASGELEVFFGPSAPADQEHRWIKTNPNAGWFAYFRIYGPQEPAFDGRWRLGDFEPLA